MHADGREIMAKTAIGLFKDSATADKVVAHLLKSGFSRDGVRLVRRPDFDGTPGPETDILRIGGLPQERAGRYWEAVRYGRVLVAITSGGETADRAVGIMDQDGVIDIEERTAKPVEGGGARVASSADPDLYPQRPAAQLFEVS
jgi:hypothetical protein